MWRAFLNLFHRPAVRFDTRLQDTVLRSRKLLRHALVALVIGACAWVALESAKALSMF